MFHKTQKVQLCLPLKPCTGSLLFSYQWRLLDLKLFNCWEAHLSSYFKTLLLISTDPGRHICMWITPSAQVNVSVPAGTLTVIFGLLLPNHILFIQGYSFHQSPAGSLLGNRTDDLSYCNRQQKNQRIGGTKSRDICFQQSIIKNKLGRSNVF